MRDVTSENKVVNRFNTLAGLLLITGLIALAVGTEMKILELWATDQPAFWAWQGVWALFHAIEISVMGRLLKVGYKEMHGNSN